MPGLRVVLDTNVLVSGLAYPGSVPGRVVTAWRQGALDVVLSRYILDEVARVLPRLSRIQMTSAEIRDLTDSFMFLADIVEPVGGLDADLRDPADQPILLTLVAARADYLITGGWSRRHKQLTSTCAALAASSASTKCWFSVVCCVGPNSSVPTRNGYLSNGSRASSLALGREAKAFTALPRRPSVVAPRDT
jgi:uncharacterized protein